MIRKRPVTGFSVALPSMKMMTLDDLRFSAMSNRLQNGLFSASSRLFGPSTTLFTALTELSVWTSRVSFAIRSK